MSFIKQLQRLLDRDDKRLEITLYSDCEVCFFILESRIPILVNPKNGYIELDTEGYDLKLNLEDIQIIHNVMVLLTGAMPEIREWVEEF